MIGLILIYLLLALILLSIVIYWNLPRAKLVNLLLGIERRLAKLKPYRVQIGDMQIEYLRGGQGTPILLLHGFGADKDNWSRIARHLTTTHDVIAVDLPGFGESSQSLTADYDLLSQVERIKQFLDLLSIDKCHIAGSSMGGYIAGNFAVRYPELIASLWLLSPLGIQSATASEMFTAIKQGAHPMVLPRSATEFRQLFDFFIC